MVDYILIVVLDITLNSILIPIFWTILIPWVGLWFLPDITRHSIRIHVFGTLLVPVVGYILIVVLDITLNSTDFDICSVMSNPLDVLSRLCLVILV